MVKLDITLVFETNITGANPVTPTIMTKSQEQAERAKLSPARYNRQFARRQWRKSYADDTFRFRGKFPSCPSFQSFLKKS